MSAPCETHSRRDDPILLIDMIGAAVLLIDGATISTIAARLKRPVPQVRAMIYGLSA